MRTHTPPDGRGPRRYAEAGALLTAALVFAAVVVFITACGSGDLVFPGQPAPTAVFTDTPGPTETP
jgi:hypothetical protein